MGETVASHSEWIEGHEKRCEDRFTNIQTSVHELKECFADMQATLRNLSRGAVGLLLAITGWCLVQLYNSNEAAHHAEQAATNAAASMVAANRDRITALEQRDAPPVTVVQQTPPIKP